MVHAGTRRNEMSDFDPVNGGDVRSSLGTVDVRTGESTCFERESHTATAAHVMADGAHAARRRADSGAVQSSILGHR